MRRGDTELKYAPQNGLPHGQFALFHVSVAGQKNLLATCCRAIEVLID
jgi:hypothetical protein